MTFCPDCEQEIAEDAFVAHREHEHPPTQKTLVVDGIQSKQAMGYDPPDPED